MSYNLFLDDERYPSDVNWINLPRVKWFIVRNYDEFIDVIKNNGIPSIVSFDHDLAHEHYPFNSNSYSLKVPYDSYKEKTGYHCAEFLLKLCKEKRIKLPEYYVHSMNPIGKSNILNLLKNEH